MLETVEDRVWSLEDRVSRIEKQGVLENAKTQKLFEETTYFSKVEYLQLLTPKVQVFCVNHYHVKTFKGDLVL